MKGQRVTVLGAGRTGQAAARFLARQGAQVFLSDRASISPLVQQELTQLAIDYEEGGHTDRALETQLIIPSPGVPYGAPVLQEARRRGIPIMGELELAYRFCPTDKIIAVTGTVGKTTTTHLVSEILKAHGHPTLVAGNIGQPWIARLAEIKRDTIVILEVSSFQLEHVDSFRPHIGTFTRFAPHHLDRHGSLERYFALKCRLFARQTERDFAVVQRDIELPRAVRSQIVRFSVEDFHDPKIPAHQREDLAAALHVTRLIDSAIDLKRLDLEKALRLPHRLEFVAQVHGIRFYNDAKATSPAATQAALAAFEEPLVLILGGYDEGGHLGELAQAICQKDVEAVFLIGQTQPRFSQALRSRGYRAFHIVEDLQEAVESALQCSSRVCLFSPAAPSFDQYKNYEQRGAHFKRLVLAYAQRAPLQTAITPSSDQLAQTS